jgi:Spherulation-specific family 4
VERTVTVNPEHAWLCTPAGPGRPGVRSLPDQPGRGGPLGPEPGGPVRGRPGHGRPGQGRPGHGRGRTGWLRAGQAAVVALAAAAGLVLAVRALAPSPRPCQASFVPAFFSPQGWNQAIGGSPAPDVMILDISGSGAGTAPDPAFRAVVSRARAAGVLVLGYADTGYSSRPAAAVEADVRDYRAWYGVTSIFLDQAGSGAAELGYYRALAGFIRGIDPGGRIWLNPGLYPDKRYLSVANVLMVFEGSYAAYRDIRVPGWAARVPADRFAHTIYATPESGLSAAIGLSRQRHAGYVYVTDGSGPNPYAALPRYWSTELGLLATRC